MVSHRKHIENGSETKKISFNKYVWENKKLRWLTKKKKNRKGNKKKNRKWNKKWTK